MQQQNKLGNVPTTFASDALFANVDTVPATRATMSKQRSTLSKESFDYLYSIRHCCWCERGLKRRWQHCRFDDVNLLYFYCKNPETDKSLKNLNWR